MRITDIWKMSAMLLFSGFVACSEETPDGPDVPDPPGPEDTLEVVLNEVCGTAGAQWVEIVNMSDEAADIAGIRIVYEGPDKRQITLGRIPDGTSMEPGAYHVFDSEGGTMSGSFDMSKSMILYLVSAANDTLSVFDRDKDMGNSKPHPKNGSYARFSGEGGSARWAVTTTPTKGEANIETQLPDVNPQNGIWMRGEHFSSANFATLAGYGINNVLVNESAVSSMGEAAFKTRVDAAVAAGVNVHIWFQCFYKNGSWVNPVNTDTKQYNQAYFDELIARAEKYVRYGNIAGIHLDYVRYPGTAYKYVYPETNVSGQGAINEFCRQISAAAKAIDPDVRLSAALMNETNQNAYYYGQNAQKMSQYIDILMPMVYRYSWSGSATVDKGADWVFNTTKWFANEIATAGTDAEVWAGIMTYKPLAANDTRIENLSAAQLEIDCGLSLKNASGAKSGATGVVLFRYGIVNYFDMTAIYY